MILTPEDEVLSDAPGFGFKADLKTTKPIYGDLDFSISPFDRNNKLIVGRGSR